MRDGLSLLDQALVLNYNESPTADLHLISTSKIYDMLGLADRQRIFELIKVLLEGKVDSTLQNARGLFKMDRTASCCCKIYSIVFMGLFA